MGFIRMVDYLASIKDYWEELTGEQPPNFRLSDETVRKLRTTYDSETELLQFMLSSVAAWLWSHDGADHTPPFNLNTSLASEGNALRVQTFLAKGMGHQFAALSAANDTHLNEYEWFQLITSGEVPDFEIFTPCPAWVVVSQLFNRKLPPIDPLLNRVGSDGRTFGKVYVEEANKVKNKSGATILLSSVQSALDSAITNFLIHESAIISVETDEGVVMREMRPGALGVLAVSNLVSRDKKLVRLYGLDPVFLSGPVADIDEWDASPATKAFVPLKSNKLMHQAAEAEHD